jgi:hypothetical protein
MRLFFIFLTSAILACIAAIALLAGLMPPGEGSFGIAKMVPVILTVLIPVCFCLIWFPANALVWLFIGRESRHAALRQARPLFLFSGTLFVLSTGLCGYYLVPYWLHTVRLDYRLEDQFGKPISGAGIRRHDNFTQGRKDTELKSDAEGLFHVSCKPGESFSLQPHKEGYAVASENTTGAYSEDLRLKQKSATGRLDLIVIKMWKAQGEEPLVGIGREYKLHFTNAPIYFDLISGLIVSNGGDLRITVNRPEGIISGRNQQEWSVKFEVVDGGLMDSSGTERLTYFAPESGYQPSKSISNKDRLPEGGVTGFRTGFYMKSRNGQVYAKLGVSFRINETPNDLMYITFGGIANTNYSRNWEAASGTYLKPGFLPSY